MEGVLKGSLLILTVILLAKSVLSDVRTTVEGITVARERGKLDCDSLWCPEGTDLCRVTKIYDPNDDQYFLRIRKCIDSKGSVLKKERVRELTGRFNETMTVTLQGGENGAVIFSNPNPEDAEM